MNNSKNKSDRKIPKDMKPGTEYTTNNFGNLVIVEYNNSLNVLVSFIGFSNLIISGSGNIRTGQVKNPMVCTSFGVGYLGVGEYSNKKNQKTYQIWANMLRRNYCPISLKKDPSYLGGSVCKDWLNFQNFAKWFYEESNYSADLELDKDLKIKGNKVYSPDTCLFVSRKVNNFITIAARKGKWGRGLNMTSSKKLVVDCNDASGNRTRLGLFKLADIKEAKKAYRDFKYKVRYEIVLLQSDKEVAHYLSSWTM